MVLTQKKKKTTSEEIDPEMEQIISRQRYFPESSSEPQIQTKCLAADILLLISNLETDAKCTIYLSKLK